MPSVTKTGVQPCDVQAYTYYILILVRPGGVPVSTPFITERSECPESWFDWH